MCHFYANPLSVLSYESDTQCQDEHLAAIRNAQSFQRAIERYISRGTKDDLEHAERCIKDDEYLRSEVAKIPLIMGRWVDKLLRALFITEEASPKKGAFSRRYIDALAEGLSPDMESLFVDDVRQMDDARLADFLTKVIRMYQDGDPSICLGTLTEADDDDLQAQLADLLGKLQKLQEQVADQGITLRSKYSKQSTVTRTTVIAKRVQLSKDKAALRPEDGEFTVVVDEVVRLLVEHLDVPGAADAWMSEAWVYDSRSPSQSVLVPRPRAIFERSLVRPHDYLNCECCQGSGDGDGGGVRPTMPATCVLYHLYLETGNLINVADLWTAFRGLVGGDDEGDERHLLVQFYRGLAELRALGFVKPSKKKADHIAKLKWL